MGLNLIPDDLMTRWPETGTWSDGTLLRGGHINQSLKLSTSTGLYFLQKINTQVFGDVSALEENLQQLEVVRFNENSVIMPLPLRSSTGRMFEQDESGGFWRLFPWVDGQSTVENGSSSVAKQIAARFGEWAGAVNQLNAKSFRYPLSGFHHLPTIWEAFYHAWDHAGGDRKHLASETSARLAEGVEALELYQQLISGLPLRIIHGDPKPDNQLQINGSEAIAILDLDTVMPGYLWMETGDMVRGMAARTKEDDPDLTLAGIDPEKATAVLEGYAQSVSSWATESELTSLRYGPLCIILEQALRFLTDFLQGDHYYHIDYPEHNFVRAQNQLLVWEEYADWVGF